LRDAFQTKERKKENEEVDANERALCRKMLSR
jgi:hypothetical protein